MRDNIPDMYPEPVQKGMDLAQQISNTSLSDLVHKGASWVSDHKREAAAIAVYVVAPELGLVDLVTYGGSKLLEKAMGHEAGLDQ